MEGKLTVKIQGVVLETDTLRQVLEVHGYIVLDRKTLALVTFEGYLKRYFELVSTEKTYKAAWEKLEDEHLAAFGKNRYASWHSFLNTTLYKKAHTGAKA